MVDLSASMALKGDASGYVKAASDGKRANEALRDSAQGIVPAANAATGATNRLSAAAKQAAAAQAAAAKAMANNQRGVTMLGAQVQDFATQALNGANIATAFSQQIGQATFALQGMQGNLGKVGAFLGGPWGVAITIAAQGLAFFAAKMFETEKAAKKKKDAIDEVEKAVRDYTATLGKAGQAEIVYANNLNISRQTELAKAVAVREGTKALLERFRAQQLADQADVTSPDPNRQFRIQERARFLPDIGQSIAKQDAEIGRLRGLANQSATAKTLLQVAAANDKATAATQKYELALATLAERANKGLITQEELRVASDKLTKERDAAIEATKKHRKGVDEDAKAARLAAKEQRELESDYASILKALDPLADSTEIYRKELEKIAKLRAGKKITTDQVGDLTVRAGLERLQREQDVDKKLAKDTLEKLSPEMQAAAAKFGDQLTIEMSTGADTLGDRLLGIPPKFSKAMKDGLTDAARDFGDTLVDAANALGGARFGGKIGSILSAPGGIGFLNMLGGKTGAQDFTRAFDAGFKGMNGSVADLKDTMNSIFGKTGTFTSKLGSALGAISANFETGKFAKGLTDAFGIKGSTTGGTIGSFLGQGATAITGIPGLDKVGAILGSVIGGLFKTKVKFGRSAVELVNGRVGVVKPNDPGNSSSRTSAAKGAAGALADGLNEIAAQLGGTLGDFGRITIGMRDKKWRVNLDRGSLKTSKGAQNFGKGEEGAAEAIAFAISAAIGRGAIKGLSEAVQKALKSDTDVDKALQEAIKTKQLEIAIGGVGAELEEMFRQFEAGAAENLRIAKAYGLDVTKVEALNAKNRLKVVDDIMKQRIGSLRDFLDEMATGDLFEGSYTEKRAALLAKIGTVRAQADAGDEGAADQLADLYRQLVSESRDELGTAGSEYASDRATAKSGAEAVIAAEMQRQRLAQAAAREAADMAKQQTALLDEGNGQRAVTNATLQSQNALLTAILAQMRGNGTNIGAVARIS